MRMGWTKCVKPIGERAGSVVRKGDGMGGRKIAVWLILAVATIALAAGCGGEQSSEQGGGTGGPAEARKDVRIAVVTHGVASDPYWSVAKNGVDQAAEDMGVEVEYNAPQTFDMVKMGQLIDAAVASEPDGLVVTIPDPDALRDPIQKAIDAGIPVIVFNAGAEAGEELGALTYVGLLDEFAAGKTAGQRMAQEGVDNAFCINQEVGNAALDARCDGFEAGLGGTSEVLAVDPTNPTDAQAKIETAVKGNPDINGLFATGNTSATPALAALRDTGNLEKVKLANMDFNPEVLEAIRDGDILFALDAQQYLQGYLSVVLMTQYVTTGMVPSELVDTGITFVTQENADRIIELSKQGIR